MHTSFKRSRACALLLAHISVCGMGSGRMIGIVIASNNLRASWRGLGRWMFTFDRHRTCCNWGRKSIPENKERKKIYHWKKAENPYFIILHLSSSSLCLNPVTMGNNVFGLQSLFILLSAIPRKKRICTRLSVFRTKAGLCALSLPLSAAWNTSHCKKNVYHTSPILALLL